MEPVTPLHVQLRELLREKIEEGCYGQGTMIPSERDLAAAYRINRMTAKKAVEGLVREGLLRRIQGKGTFVVRTVPHGNLQTLQGLSEALKVSGKTPFTRLVLAEVMEGGGKAGRLLELGPEERIYRILRLRYADQEPVALEDTYVPLGLTEGLEDLDFEVLSLYGVLEERGIRPATSDQSLTLARIHPREAKLLGVPPETAVFLFEFLSRDDRGRAIEYTKSYTRGDLRVYDVLLK